MKDQRQVLIENMMADSLEDQSKALYRDCRSAAEARAFNNLLESGMAYDDQSQLHWAYVRCVLTRRLELEAEIPGGPSPRLDDDLRALFDQVASKTETDLAAFARRIRFDELDHGTDNARHKEIETWLSRQIESIRARHALGLLNQSTPGAIQIGTLVVGNAQFGVDTEALADMLLTMNERLAQADAALADTLKEVAQCVKAGEKPAFSQNVADTIKALDKWGAIVGGMSKVALPLLQAWMQQG